MTARRPADRTAPLPLGTAARMAAIASLVGPNPCIALDVGCEAAGLDPDDPAARRLFAEAVAAHAYGAAVVALAASGLLAPPDRGAA